MKKGHHFYALLSRMKLIRRWSLMRNTYDEDIAAHSLQTAQIAHGLAVIRNRVFGGAVSPERAALLALYHDATEIYTGDLPTPIKYYNQSISASYLDIEEAAGQKLLSMLPDELKGDFRPLFERDEAERTLWDLVRAADKISAYCKCIEELRAGNDEFRQAEQATRKKIKELHLPEADYFMEQFISSFSLTLDELEE